MYLEHRKDVGTLRKIRAFSTAFFIIIVTRFREYVRYRFWNNVFWLLDCVCFVFHALFLRKFHRETERDREIRCNYIRPPRRSVIKSYFLP